MSLIDVAAYTSTPAKVKKKATEKDKLAFHDSLLKTELKVTQSLIDISDCQVPTRCVIANVLGIYLPTESSSYKWAVQSAFSHVLIHGSYSPTENYPRFMHDKNLIHFIKGFDSEVSKYYDQAIEPITLGIKYIECDPLILNQRQMSLVFKESVGFASYHKFIGRVLNRNLPKAGFYMLYVKD